MLVVCFLRIEMSRLSMMFEISDGKVRQFIKKFLNRQVFK